MIAHLFGNPVGTIKSLLLKVASCQYRATFWFDLFRHELRHLLVDNEPGNVYPDLDRKWKALATITDSYDEWGLSKGNEAQSFLLRQL